MKLSSISPFIKDISPNENKTRGIRSASGKLMRKKSKSLFAFSRSSFSSAFIAES